MHISRTDLNLFVVFETIYSQGGVTRAAEVLNLTQPTISHALSRLRERVGDPLFVRHGQKLVPTPLAQKMISPIRDAIKLFEKTLGELDGFDPMTAEINFTIGMRSLMENTFYLPLVLLLQQNAPSVTASSSQIDRKSLEADLSSGTLNAAIDVFLPLSSDVKREHLSSSPSVVVARRGHPLVSGKVDLETYLELDHLIVTSRALGHGPEDIALYRIGKQRRVMARCQQINTGMRIVAASDVVLTMSETFARRANIWFDNQMVPAPFNAPQIDTYLYWHSNSDSDQANKWLRGMIKAVSVETSGILPTPKTDFEWPTSQ